MSRTLAVALLGVIAVLLPGCSREKARPAPARPTPGPTATAVTEADLDAALHPGPAPPGAHVPLCVQYAYDYVSTRQSDGEPPDEDEIEAANQRCRHRLLRFTRAHLGCVRS